MDTIARLVAQGMSSALGQQVVVENRPGAAMNIAAEVVARSAPNGQILLMGAFAIALNPSMIRLNYDPLRDLAAGSQVSQVPTVMLASASTPFTSVAEVVAYARANPGTVTYGSGCVGTPSHLAPELLAQRAGIQITSSVFAPTAATAQTPSTASPRSMVNSSAASTGTSMGWRAFTSASAPALTSRKTRGRSRPSSRRTT